MPIPIFIAEFQASLFERLPSPPLTVGQVELLKLDNIVGATTKGFQDLEIEPAAVEEILPFYVWSAQGSPVGVTR